MPAPLAINNAGFSYRATFEIEGRTFKMHREFISRVAGQTCQPELEAQIAGDINALRGNVNMSFVFHRAWPPAAAVATATPASLTAPTAVTRVRLTPVAATTAPAQAGPAAPNTVDLKRAGAAGAKLRLDFLYSINPDCTSIGFATIRVVDQPRHCRITIDNGTGFTNFPASNPRTECNKRSGPAARRFCGDPRTRKLFWPATRISVAALKRENRLANHLFGSHHWRGRFRRPSC
jgi:hypothetical protein